MSLQTDALRFFFFFGLGVVISYICTPKRTLTAHAARTPEKDAQVAKLVDALFSGSSAARCAGSNPVLGTKKAQNPLIINGFIFLVGQFMPLFHPFCPVW